jgi:hypothetical protein
MESGTQSPTTTEALNEIYHAILKFQSLGTDERLVLAEILRQVDRIFGAENLRAQSLMTGALSILIFAGLLTVVEIDHPFAGTVKVGPEALMAVVKDFAEAPPQR